MGRAIVFLLGVSALSAAEPTSKMRDIAPAVRRVDELVEAPLTAAKVPLSPRANDAEFQRRIYLDLTGRLPPLDKAVAFLDNKEPNKRAKLIDELLDSGDYGRHFARYWAELFVKRDGEMNSKLKPAEFRIWMASQFNIGAGWDQIVTKMLTVEGTEASGFFFQANKLNGDRPSPAKVVGATGNLFLGIQLQCAECHDHPYTDAWKQNDFWGMAAFFGRTRYEKGKSKGDTVITEADPPPPDPMLKKKPKEIKQPLNGTIDIPDPLDAMKVKATVKAKHFGGDEPKLTEKGPHRPQFAAWLTAPTNERFALAAVNRLWAFLFAKGFVNPLDDMNPDNKPSHPDLLAFLAKEFRDAGHDYRHLLRVLCNTAAYQRTSRALPGNRDDDQFARMPVKLLQGEVLLSCLDQVLGAEVMAPTKNKERFVSTTQSNAELFSTAIYDDDPANYSFGALQLLRLMNAEVPRRSPALVARLMQTNGTEVERLFLLTLGRRPTADESKAMTEFVKREGDAAKGYASVLWVLLNSAEFVANH